MLMNHWQLLTVLLPLLNCIGGCATRSPVTPGMELKFTRAATSLATNDPAYHTTLQLRWLGTACYSIQLGDKIIFTDPFLTYHSLLRVGLGGALRSDPLKVQRKLAGVPVPHAIFVGHSHYDHVLDAAECLSHPGWNGVPIYGSESTRHVLCGSGHAFTNTWRPIVTNAGWQVVAEGIRYKAILATHARQARALPLFYPGKVDRCLRHTRACDFKVGDTYALLFELSNDRATNTVYFVGAAHHGDEGFSDRPGLPVDVAILCVASWKNVQGYPSQTIRRLRPRHIVASHYDDFFQVNDKPPAVVPLADLEGFLTHVQKTASYSEFESIVLPAVGTVTRFEPKQAGH